VESWTLKIEQQLSPNAALGFSYAPLGSPWYPNCFPLTRTCRLRRFAQLRRARRLPSWSVLTISPGAPLANNSVWNTTHWLSEGISSYHGLEVDVNRRLSHGLQFSRGLYVFKNAR